MDKAGPSRVTPPPTRPGALKRPVDSGKEKGSMRPTTPPKASSPATPQEKLSEANAAAGSGFQPKATPKSPPPIGLSPVSSPTTPAASVKEKSESPGRSGDSQAKSEKREKSRSPLGRRPQGAKQRARFAKGNYGDQRVRFANPIDNRGRDGRADKGGGKGKEKSPGKGKGKVKGKQKSKSKEKSKGKDREKGPRENRSRSPGGGDGKKKEN